MNWFSGSLSEAVNTVKARESLLTVFVAERDESEWDYLWKSESVVSALCEMINLRLVKDSQELDLFKQVYPVPIVPSIYFVSHTGKIELMIAQKVDPELFLEKFAKALDSVQSEAASPRTPPLAQPLAGKTKEEIAREKIDEVRRLKNEQANKEERERERRRIEEGKALQEADRRRKEMKDKQVLDEFKKAKQEERAAREAVKRQIELDRMERRKKASPVPGSSHSPEVMQSPPSVRSNSSESNLLIRLTDGSTLRQRFPSSATLADAKAFCAEKRSDVSGFNGNDTARSDFHILTTFPNRIFTDADLSKSLSDLGLVPSGSLIIKQKGPSRGRGASTGFDMSSIISRIAAFFSSVFAYILSFFSSAPTPPPVQEQESSNASEQRTDSRMGGVRRRNQGLGNVYGLDTRNGDGDEAKDSFNGNSTVHSHDD